MISNRSIRTSSFLALAATTALSLSACGGGGDSGPVAGSDVSSCQIDQALVKEAQAEGAVSMYTGGHSRESAEATAAGFEAAYGIPVTVVRQASDDIARMVDAELASGKVNADVVSFADASAMAALEAEGALSDPEVPNLSDIADGLDDASSPQVPISIAPLGVIYNSATDTEVPGSWEELPNFDGTVAIADPGQSGTSVVFFSLLTRDVSPTYLQSLSTIDSTVSDSSLALTQLVLTGEADLAIPGLEPSVLEAQAGGEPLDIAFPDGPVPVLVSEIGSLKDSPNPAAAKLLVDYHLCQAGQQIVAEAGARSVLVDGPVPDGLTDIAPERLSTITLAELDELVEPTRSTFSSLF